MKLLGRTCLAVLPFWASLGLGCGGPSRTAVDVFVASSMAEAFEMFEQKYEKENPTVDIRLNTGGSSTLVRQINAGANVDIFVPADAEISKDIDRRFQGSPSPIATNRLTLIVPNESDDVTSVHDLGQDRIVIGRCASGVPCGDATDRYLDQTGTTLRRPSEHTNVGGVVAQVVGGDASAGFVYITDAQREADSTRTIELDNAPMVTPVALTLSTNVENSGFIQHILSIQSQAALEELGFGKAA